MIHQRSKVDLVSMMLKILVCAIFILPSLFSCSKEPTASVPFTLYVDNAPWKHPGVSYER